MPALPIRSRQNRLKPHLRSMRCDLTDEEDAAFARLLSDTINDHRYLPLARIRALKRILGRIRPERSPAPLPPPIRHREIHRACRKSRKARFWKIDAVRLRGTNENLTCAKGMEPIITVASR